MTIDSARLILRTWYCGAGGAAASGGGGAGSGGGTGGGGTGGGTFGRIYVADYHFSDAGFVGAAAFFSSAGRTRATIGPCEIVTYADVAAAIGTSSAGDISIAISGRSSPIPLARPQDGGIPSYFTYNEHIFNGGETVTVTATGADVPAFATTLTAPTRPTLTAVGIAANGVIDRSQAITVRWTGGSPQLSVSLSGTTDAGLRVVECRFDAAAGSGTILPTVLQQLPSGLAGSFGIAAITSKPLNAGSWSFDVDAIDYLAVSSITMQ